MRSPLTITREQTWLGPTRQSAHRPSAAGKVSVVFLKDACGKTEQGKALYQGSKERLFENHILPRSEPAPLLPYKVQRVWRHVSFHLGSPSFRQYVLETASLLQAYTYLEFQLLASVLFLVSYGRKSCFISKGY